VDSVKRDAARYLFRVEVAETKRQARPQAVSTAGPRKVTQAKSKKVGRNAPCPCGSGVKSKKCSKTPDCLGAWRS